MTTESGSTSHAPWGTWKIELDPAQMRVPQEWPFLRPRERADRDADRAGTVTTSVGGLRTCADEDVESAYQAGYRSGFRDGWRDRGNE